MPRYVVNESEDENEPKTGRKTRAALAASTTATDSPIRRSTRIRHGSVNPDGSSPESINGTQVTKRVTRRRAAAAAAGTMDTLTVPENHRTLRSRKNSVSSNVSDNVDAESVPGTPRQRSSKRLSIVEPSPSTPKLGPKTRRSIRASSETKSPAPVVRTTRRTRASSIDLEPSKEQTTSIATPTKKRRQQASAPPSEPVVTEELNESDDDIFIEIPDEESENEISPANNLSKSSSRTSSSAKKTPKKNDSSKEYTDAEINADESLEESTEKSLETEISPVKEKSENVKAKELRQLKSPVQIQVENISVVDNLEEEKNSAKPMQTLVIKTKRNSLDKSKELGMEIEDLLNKSTAEQEKSPGNKENEKLNISPQKVKKNLEFTVSNVNIVRAGSLGSSKFVNKSASDKKMNASLDEQVLSKSQYDIGPTKSVEIQDNNKIVNDGKKNSVDSSPKRKSPKKNQKQDIQVEENEGKNKTSYTKVDETVVENEIIEEFRLYDSNDEDSKSEFSLIIEDNGDGEKKVLKEGKKDNDNDKNQCSDLEDEEEDLGSSNDVFEKPNPSKNDNESSRKSVSRDNIEEEADEDEKSKKKNKKQDITPKKRLSLNSKEIEEVSETSSNKKDKKDRKSRENREKIQRNESATDNVDIENDSKKNIDEEEPMDTNENEENENIENSIKVSPKKQSLDKKNESVSNVGDSENKDCQNQEPDSDSNIAIDDLFKNISAEEWNKKHKNQSPEKDVEKKRRSSSKSKEETLRSEPSEESKDQTDQDDDLDLGNQKSLIESKTNDCDNEASGSDDTLILKKNDSGNKVNKKRRSSVKVILEEAETEDNETEENTKRKKSPKKSAEHKNSQRNSLSKSQKEDIEMDVDLSEAETITDNNIAEKDLEEEEKQPTSSKNTPKMEKKKSSSPVKSVTKLKKSVDVYEFEDSIEVQKNNKESDDDEDEDEDEGEDESSPFVNEKIKKLQNKKKANSSLLKTPRTPLNKNSSTLVQVDSDSGRDNFEDDESSDNNDKMMPSFLFNVETSGDEDDDDNSDNEEEEKGESKNESKNTIDSDIAREMNLAGDDDVEYSDDDVPGDECRDSESEHSDENDDGSDIDDFVVADDDVESSVYSEEDSEPKMRFKRILAQAVSEEEEEIDDDNEEMEAEQSSDGKEKRKSVSKTVPNVDISIPSDEEVDETSPELEGKKLDFSLESERSLSTNKKTKKGKSLNDLRKSSELLISPSLEELEKSNKKLNKLSKPIRSLMNKTIDLCTPESNAIIQLEDPSKTPGLDKSADKKIRSAKKLKKNLVEDLEPSELDEMNETKDNEEEILEEEEAMLLQETLKTPNKEKKTSKSLRKSQRDSLQLIEETATLKPQISDLNKSMSTPNSESPVTKFLKKERLNESLPLIELKKRRSKSFDKRALSNMEEEEQQDDENEDDNSEGNQPKEIRDISENDESDGDDDIEENDDQVNENHDNEDEEDDEMDEEHDKDEENGDLDNEVEESKEKEESSEEEIEIPEIPETKNIKKSRKSKERKTLSLSPGVAMKGNGRSKESKEDRITPDKKRARLESSDTPQGLKVTKKMKIAKKSDSTVNESDSDEAPESLGFSEARTKAIKEMKEVSDSLKATKEAKKQKRREQLDRIRKEKEAKEAREVAKGTKKRGKEEKGKSESMIINKNNLKRLPEDLLDNLSDLPERPQKKRKLSTKKDEKVVLPSRYMFSPGKTPKSSIKIEDYKSPLSTVGCTTHFNVVNLEKVKKQQPKKAAAVISFRERMLARNPRQPVSAFLMYQAKQKASGKQLSSRK